ncbi:hypothetical protein CRUP_016882, partial [Coryphaenoides rupestris]
MAASIVQRCFAAAVKVKRPTPLFTARRGLLSAAYSDPALWEGMEKDPQNLALLAKFMDSAYEKKLPVSSLTISRISPQPKLLVHQRLDGSQLGAFAVVEEVMLQEAFDLPSTQILSFYTIGSYLATKPTLS